MCLIVDDSSGAPVENFKNHKKILKPKKPLREFYNSDVQYLRAIGIFKGQRTKWLNSLKDKSIEAIKSKEILKDRKNKRKYSEKLFRRKQLDKIKQKRLF